MARHLVLSAVLSCTFVVLGLWGVYGLGNGFGYETGLIAPSEDNPGLTSFLYPDPLRKFTSLFYHLSYVIGDQFGVRGSYVPYQIVYAALWIGRGVLTFAVVRALLPDRPALALLSGLFATLHSGDLALNWVGQLNQMGFVFWTLCSCLLLLYGTNAKSLAESSLWAGFAALCGYLALWSYESPLTVLAAFPFAIMIIRRPRSWPSFFTAGAIFSIPVIWYAALNIHRYVVSSGAGSYQAGVLRKDWSPLSIASDLALHLQNAVGFWSWPHVGFSHINAIDYGLGLAGAVAGIVIGLSAAFAAERRVADHFRRGWTLLRFGLVSLGLLFLSYLVPLVLTGNRSLFRTEFLPTFAAGCLFAVALYTLLGSIPQRLRIATASIGMLVFATFAVQCGVNSGRSQRTAWERFRGPIASILTQVPDIQNGTALVLRDVPLDPEPFFHNNMWFDLGIRLAYPNKVVAGVYFSDDGAPARGQTIKFDQGKPGVVSEHYPTRFQQNPKESVRHVIVFDFHPPSAARLVQQGPVKVGPELLPAEIYKPCEGVGLTPHPIAVRRYHPIQGAGSSPCAPAGRP
jgi:hypothetical protein